MKQEEVAKYADRVATINERIQLAYHTAQVETGYFFKNKYSTEREKNLWNFVIMNQPPEQNIHKVVNGEEIESIKIIRLFNKMLCVLMPLCSFA